MTGKMKYDQAVNYDTLDLFKRACQVAASGTTPNLARHGFTEAPSIRGESVYLMETANEYLAHVEEALGTKTIVADAIYKLTGKSYYRNVAIDDVSTIVNDLCVCGALPISVAMYAAVGDGAYFEDKTRREDLASGFAEGCQLAGATWSGGETQTLRDIIKPDAMILGGSAIGRIAPKSLRIPCVIHDGDDIVLFASSGVHTNGLTMCRSVASKLPQGYLTPLSDGQTYGEALLAPSVIYTRFIADCQDQNIPIHYAVHVTGHGWRKLMRLNEAFVYRIHYVPPAQAVFKTLMETESLDLYEAYATFNMGVGFAVFVSPSDTPRILKTAQAAGLTAWHAGKVSKENGRKAVEITPLKIAYEAETLNIRA